MDAVRPCASAAPVCFPFLFNAVFVYRHEQTGKIYGCRSRGKYVTFTSQQFVRILKPNCLLFRHAGRTNVFVYLSYLLAENGKLSATACLLFPRKSLVSL